MFQGYLSVAGREIINSERTAAYVRRFLPTLNLNECEKCSDVHNALSQSRYLHPRYDTAPWYRLNDPDTENFYGLYPLAVQGVEDSTSQTLVTQFTTDGGFQSMVRHGTKEVRVRGVLIGKNRDGVGAGLRWLHTILNAVPCGWGQECYGREITYFTNCPGAPTSAAGRAKIAKYRRTLYRVEVLDGARVIQEQTLSSGALMEVEFTFSVGVPWAFADTTRAVTSSLLTGAVVNETNCPPRSDAYSSLVVDPNLPPLSRPPVPPSLNVVDMPDNWVRYTAVIPRSTTARWGRLTPVVKFVTGAQPVRNVRVRFYRDPDGKPGLSVPVCDWDGDFFLTYMPAHSVLTVDGIRRDTRLKVGSATELPAAHLVVGSQGRPPTWPTMGCDTPYLVVIDADNGLGTNTQVLVDVAVGE